MLRDHILATAILLVGVAFRSYAYLTSTVALVVAFYALLLARRALGEAREAMEVVVRGDNPLQET